MSATVCSRTFIFLRCFTFCTFLLAGRTILSALTHSSYLQEGNNRAQKERRRVLSNQVDDRRLSNTNTHFNSQHPTFCQHTRSTKQPREENEPVLSVRGHNLFTFTMKRETVLTTNHHTNHVRQQRGVVERLGEGVVVWGGGLLGCRMRERHNIAHKHTRLRGPPRCPS